MSTRETPAGAMAGAPQISEGARSEASVADQAGVPPQLVAKADRALRAALHDGIGGPDVDLEQLRHERDEQRQLREDAARWRVLQACPHLNDLLADWLEWHRRRECRADSNAISAGCDWRAHASAPTYAELDRRRRTYSTPARTPDEIRERATRSWSAIDRGRA